MARSAASRASAGRCFHGIRRVGCRQFATAPGDVFSAFATARFPPSRSSKSSMNALSQIVGVNASPFTHNLCVAEDLSAWHSVGMETDDKNGGPNYLRAWREKRKLSQAALAEKVGTSSNMIQ